jgi:hypothetical protein
MNREKRKRAAIGIWELQKNDAPRRPVDLTVIGEGITRLPPSHWRERMLFRGARDEDLREATGEFPATFHKERRTHPIFILSTVSDLGHRVCPCSSKNWGVSRFIRKGCILDITRKEQDRDSYLVEEYAFILPSDPAFTQGLFFLGQVPESCLVGCD